MEPGNAAQWASVLAALLLGLRAELRAFRQRRAGDSTNQAAAHAELTKILAQAIATIPSVAGPINGQDIKDLSDASRRAVGPVAAAFPHAAGLLLELADQLDDITSRPETTASRNSRSALDVFMNLISTLRLLSITSATRITLTGGVVSMQTFDSDRYCKEFEGRYRHVRDVRFSQMAVLRE